MFTFPLCPGHGIILEALLLPCKLAKGTFQCVWDHNWQKFLLSSETEVKVRHDPSGGHSPVCMTQTPKYLAHSPKFTDPSPYSRDTSFPPCQIISSSSEPSQLVTGHSMVLLSSKLISLEGESHYRKEGYCKFCSFCYTMALNREICVFCQEEE